MAAVINPGLGLVYDKIPLSIPARALQDGMNFRIKNGRLSNANLGWSKLSEDWTLNGHPLLIDTFRMRSGDVHTVFATPTDLYRYDAGSDAVFFLTPAYVTGTASASGTAVTGVGTTWSTNALPGDFIAFGSATENDPGATWHEIDTVNSDTSITLKATAGSIADGPYTLRRIFRGSTTGLWDYDLFIRDEISGDDLWMATNTADWVVSWNGSDTFATLHPELGFKCQTLTVYKNQMLYGNLVYGGVNKPSSFVNSDIGKPLYVGDTGTGVADEFVAHAGADGIEIMWVLGDYVILYSQRHIVLAQFVGDPYGYVLRQTAQSLGPVGPRAIADFGDYHQFIGADAEYRFDGATVGEINNHVWRDVLRRADPIRRRNIYSFFDEENGDLIWSVPLTTDPGAGDALSAPAVAITEHYLEFPNKDAPAPHSQRSFPFLSAGYKARSSGITFDMILDTFEEYNYAWNDQFFTVAFPQTLVGGADGTIYVLGTQTADGDALLPSYIRTGRWATGSGRERNLLARVYPFAEPGTGPLLVTTFMTDHAAGPAASKGTLSFDLSIPEGGHFVSPFRAGRFVELAFSKTDGAAWTLWGWDTDIRGGGLR